MRDPDLLWDQMRSDALRFPCGECGRKEGDVCINLKTGDKLTKQAAHLKRLRAAGHGLAVPA